MRREALSNCISLGQGEERRNYQAGEDRKQKISLLSAKVRTRASVKPGSRRCRAVVLSGHCQREFWKQQGAKSNEYSGLAQSHIPLPTTTRALISTPRARKWRGQIKRKKEKKKKPKPIHRAEASSSCILLGQNKERRAYQAQGGRKQKMSPQTAKVRTTAPAKPESRRCRAIAL